VDKQIIPVKIRKELRNKEIRALYRIGYTMEEICKKLDVSKTTVFFAVNKGRRSSKEKKAVK